MSFDSGSINCTIFTIPGKLPEDFIARFAQRKASSIDMVGADVQLGWVGGRHLFDVIDEESTQKGRFHMLNLRSAQRKIPGSYLTALCKQEEHIWRKANQRDYTPSKERRAIREGLTERMLMQMPPVISGIPVVIADGEETLFVGAKSNAQIDLVTEWLTKALGIEPYQFTPALLLEKLFQITPSGCPAIQFAKGAEDEPNVGRDFLTWLWYYSENGSPVRHNGYEFEFQLLGPLVFGCDNEAQGAQETSVKNGECPTFSREAKAALLSGKKLKKAKFQLTRGQNIWSGTIEADNFAFSSVKLPETDAQDESSRFEERIEFMLDFKAAMEAYFKTFGEAILNPNFSNYQSQLQEWALNRAER